MGLSSLFGPGSKVILPNLSGGINGANPANSPSVDTRTQFTGGLSNTGGTVQGNTLGPQGASAPTTELGGHRAGFSGSYGPDNYTGGVPGQSTPVQLSQMFNPVTGQYSFPQQPTAPTQLPAETWFQHGGGPSVTQFQPFKQTTPAVNIAGKLGAEMGPPKPPEPTHTYSTEGEWGGGSWYANGAPAGMQPTWLQSYNGGNTWQTAAQQPKGGSAPTQAPQGNWSVLNQGAAPQWIQRG